MALTKSSGQSRSSTSCSAGGSATGSGVAIGYGISGVAKITNGGTGPTVACGLYLDFSADNSTWVTGPLVGLGDTANSAVTYIPFSLGIGAGGDFAYFRTRFTGNTGQAVTVEDTYSSTTAL